MGEHIWIVRNPSGKMIGTGLSYVSAAEEAVCCGEMRHSKLYDLRSLAQTVDGTVFTSDGYTLTREPLPTGTAGVVLTEAQQDEIEQAEGERIFDRVCEALKLDPNDGDCDSGDHADFIASAVRAHIERLTLPSPARAEGAGEVTVQEVLKHFGWEFCINGAGCEHDECRIPRQMAARIALLEAAITAALTTAERERDEARKCLAAEEEENAVSEALLTKAISERDEARRERDAARDAVRLALTELDWQMEAQSRCGEYGAECPLQDAGKWNSEHMEARVACRRALDAAEAP